MWSLIIAAVSCYITKYDLITSGELIIYAAKHII